MPKSTVLKVEAWPIERVVPYAKNARKIPQSAIDKVASSIREYGWQVPIVLDADGVIMAGHVRHLAAKQLGQTSVPVIVASHLTPAQRKGYRLADNRTADEASFENGLVLSELDELKDFGFDLALTGFDTDEIEAMLKGEREEEKQSKKSGENTISFTDEQWEIVGQAIFRLRQQEQDADISDGRAVELISADFIAGLPTEQEAVQGAVYSTDAA